MRNEAMKAAMGGGDMRWFRAPGRVNLMGDHTDYNEGFVLPMTIELDCAIVARNTGDGRIRLTSLEAGGPPVDISADGSYEPDEVEPAWGRLAAGVVRVLAAEGGVLGGLEAVISSTVPQGAGLGSSAALEVALALALLDPREHPLPPAELARLCAEGEFAATGVPCGIMDQLTALEGRTGHALLVDCRSASVEHIPMPESIAVFAIHCGRPRALAATEYAQRRAACERIAAAMGLATLRDATLQQVLDEPYARHVVTENLRVLVTARALRHYEMQTLGEMFDNSHKSLRDDYQVSIPELDALVESFVGAGAIGARMTGAGFGGCVVALAEAELAEAIVKRALFDYRRATGLEATAYRCRPSPKAGPYIPDQGS